jgi:hypothetical protein
MSHALGWVEIMFYYPSASIAKIITYRCQKKIHTTLHYWIDKIINRHEYERLVKLRNSMKGRNAFVFANGPSLTILNPKKIHTTGYDIFAVNGYLWSDFSKTAKPSHYVLSDPICFESIKKNHISTTNNDLPEKYLLLLSELSKNDISLFIPMKYIKSTKPNNKTFGFCDIENELSPNITDITKPRGYLSMTAYKALAVALYLGYDKIYICGFDNDYFKHLESNKENEIFYIDKHFFDSGKKINALGIAGSIGDYLYRDHFLFKHFSKFPSNSIYNLDTKSLNTCFNKNNDLDVYL